MKKTLLSFFAVGLTVAAVAQTNGRLVKSNKIFTTSQIQPVSITAKATAAICDTISTITSTNITVAAAGSDTATPGCSPNAGYVYGSNCYGDLEKANFFAASMYSLVPTAKVYDVIVGLYNAGTEGTGGAGTTTVGVNIYSGTNPATAPGTNLGSTVATMAQITAAHTSTNPLFFYKFTFASPITLPTSGGFFASVTCPTTAGDTIAIISESGAAANLAWEYWSDATWHSISSAWGTNGNLLVMPVICDMSPAGINESALNKNITVLPNPTSGLVNVVVTLASKEDLTISVSNALGQTVINNEYNSIVNDMISLDLGSLNNGVYFVTVSNGKDKMVKKVVLNK